MTSQTTTTDAADPTTSPDAPATAATEPLPPASQTPPAAQTPPLFHPASPAEPAAGAPPAHDGPAAVVEPTPWYRRVWVVVVGALVAALVFFGAGFVAGNAAALFNGVVGVQTGVPAGPGFGGDRDGDGFAPGGGRPGFGEPGERPGFEDQDGDGDAETGSAQAF
ncbi:hypothetical protein GCM10017608_30840 [Agromyces luteolus]|uniref:Uncharacterized protein n=1 Tax=Agromyces luteolus TaxID=88373 RepID=A0A7C9LHW9_9MICO|nr:hypothetical protein [Agromyces luteolus]MUN07534.1 hypothetical protein [Agromyces luteolus]GLK29148.1 hypothetical protein GCM10017608_30840 [Agromyces luteolus]